MSFLRALSEPSILPPALAEALPGMQVSLLQGAVPEGYRNRQQSELLRLYATSPWVRLALDTKADRVATASWQLFAPTRKLSRRSALGLKSAILAQPVRSNRLSAIKAASKDGELRPVVDHPLLRMLRQGVPYHFTGSDAAALEQVTRDLVGESFGLLVRDRGGMGIPIGSLPLPPSWVQLPNAGTSAFRVGWGAIRREVTLRDLAWMKIPDPYHPYARGVGRVQSLDHDVATYEHAMQYLLWRYRNRSRPDLMILASFGSDRNAEQFASDIESRHRGTTRAGRISAVNIPQGSSDARQEVHIKELNQSAADLSTVDLTKAERDAILQVTGTPPSVIGATESANRAVAYMGEVSFRRNSVVPSLERRRAFLQARFLDSLVDEPPEYGEDRLILDYELPELVDEDLQRQIVDKHGWAFDANEVRRLAGHGERDYLAHVHAVPTKTVLRRLDEEEKLGQEIAEGARQLGVPADVLRSTVSDYAQAVASAS